MQPRATLFVLKPAQTKSQEDAPMETTENPEPRQVLCSGCLRLVPESEVHVIPYFNSSAQGYVTTYRCAQCWSPALEETRAQLATTEDAALIASAVAFFQRNGVFLHEALRGDPLSVVRPLLLRMIDLVRSETIRPRVSTVLPNREAKATVLEMNRNEMKNNEKLAEAAYDAMYEASPASAKDCFDDARSFLDKAIDLAKRAGLEDEATRLTARRDHIASVYNSQFRGIW
jgi:hypothetical protein